MQKKSKCIYNGLGMAFHGKGFWSFDDGSAQNVALFWFDTSSSSYTDNPINKFLVLDKVPAEGVAFGHHKKKFINFSKANTKFCSSLHYIDVENYLYVNKTDTYKFKAKDNVS